MCRIDDRATPVTSPWEHKACSMSRFNKPSCDAAQHSAWSFTHTITAALCVVSITFAHAAEVEVRGPLNYPAAVYCVPQAMVFLQTRCSEGRWWGSGSIGQDSLIIAARSDRSKATGQRDFVTLDCTVLYRSCLHDGVEQLCQEHTVCLQI